MKAKVKTTGEIIDVEKYECDHCIGWLYKEWETEQLYKEDELVFLESEVSTDMEGFVTECYLLDFKYDDWIDVAEQLNLQPNDKVKITISKKVYYE